MQNEREPSAAYPSPGRLLFVVGSAIFVVELAFMLVRPYLHGLSAVAESFIDAIVLLSMVAPVLYLMIYRPLVDHIEERKKADMALRESEERYRSLVMTMTSVVWTADAQGKFAVPQPMWERYTGQPWERHAGFGWMEMLHPEDRGPIKGIWLKALEEKRMDEIGGRVWHAASGKYRYFVAKATPIADSGGNVREWVGTVTDVDDRMRAEEQTRESKQFLEKVMASATNAIYVMDLDGKLRLVNQGAVNIFGYPRDELIGVAFERMFESDLVDEMNSRFVNTAVKGIVVTQYETEIVRKDRQRRYITFSFAPLYQGGEIVSVVGTAEDITARKIAEERLRESRERLQAIMDNTTSLISLKDVWGRYMLVNRQFENIYHVKNRDISNMMDGDIFDRSVAGILRANDANVLKTRAPITVEEVVHHEDGAHTYLSTKFPLMDTAGVPYAICSIATDITERKKIQEQIKETKQFLENVMKSTTNVIYVVDMDGKFHMINQRVSEITGYDAGELIGRPFSVLFPPDTLPSLREQIARVRNFGISVRQYETEIIRKDGQRRTISFSAAPLFQNSKVASIVGTADDITERKNMEREKERLIVDLNRSNSELKDFAYIVSHDLKAPLRGISSLAEWTVKDYSDRLDEEGRENLQLLLGRVKRMNNLINGILQYSRIGRVKPSLRVVDTGKILADVIDIISPPRGITVTVEGDMPEVVYDRTHLTQVFQNLISNAVTHLGKESGDVVVSCADKGGFWEFCVMDTGVGIEEKHFERIFKIFQGLKARDDVESTGIGLTLVKKITESYGGSVWLESRVGEGSRFFFTIPKGLKPDEDDTERFGDNGTIFLKEEK